jgi:hypothetical protein
VTRIERLAVKMGMVMPGPTEIGFLAAHAPGRLGHVISTIATPNGSSFRAQLAQEQTANGDPTTATTPQQTVSGTAALAAGTGSTVTTPATTTAQTATGTPPATTQAAADTQAATGTQTAAAAQTPAAPSTAGTTTPPAAGGTAATGNTGTAPTRDTGTGPTSATGTAQTSDTGAGTVAQSQAVSAGATSGGTGIPSGQ